MLSGSSKEALLIHGKLQVPAWDSLRLSKWLPNRGGAGYANCATLLGPEFERGVFDTYSYYCFWHPFSVLQESISFVDNNTEPLYDLRRYKLGYAMEIYIGRLDLILKRMVGNIGHPGLVYLFVSTFAHKLQVSIRHTIMWVLVHNDDGILTYMFQRAQLLRRIGLFAKNITSSSYKPTFSLSHLHTWLVDHRIFMPHRDLLLGMLLLKPRKF